MEANKIIKGPIRDVFLKHSTHQNFCLYLQHSQHTLGVDEAVVKVNNTAHLMGDKAMSHITVFSNKIVPTTWMTTSREVIPMEFAVVPSSSKPLAPSPGFLADFANVLTRNQCLGLFGIDTLAESDWLETKIGETSVVMPTNGHNGYDYIPVAFAFENDKPGFKVHGRCGKDHRHTFEALDPRTERIKAPVVFGC